MIKEFWQERKEEKRKQKELKKQNKKLPKTKEQKAYKIFGVFFALFLVFGSLFYTCKDIGDSDRYSWDNLIGITDDIKEKLTRPIDKNALITDEEINAIHWSNCVDSLSQSGLDVVVDNHLSQDILDSKTETLQSTLILDAKALGALLLDMLVTSADNSDISLIDLIIYSSGEDVRLKSLMYINLTSIVISENLPFVYVTTDSKLEILDNSLSLLDNKFIINDLSDEDNTEVLDVIQKNSLVGMEYYTTKALSSNINDFATNINAEIDIDGTKIKFIPKYV